VKVLVADDHPIVRSGLRRLLGEERRCEVREATNGRDALSIFREFRPDLVVLDLSMPGMGGLELIGRLKIENPGVRILVLSMHHEAIYATRALQAGALGYISKSASPACLLEALRRVGAGHGYIEHEVAQELAFASIQRSTLPFQDLSQREFEILRLLGDGCSLREIADAIGISYKTVANTCGQIKSKLGVARTADLVRIAIHNGVAQSRAPLSDPP
jgi:DNA-binding NarL/FixJ family response regulator